MYSNLLNPHLQNRQVYYGEINVNVYASLSLVKSKRMQRKVIKEKESKESNMLGNLVHFQVFVSVLLQ